MPEPKDQQMPERIEIPTPEGPVKITPHHPEKKGPEAGLFPGEAKLGAGYFRLEDRRGWEEKAEEALKGFTGAPDARKAFQEAINEYATKLIRATTAAERLKAGHDFADRVNEIRNGLNKAGKEKMDKLVGSPEEEGTLLWERERRLQEAGQPPTPQTTEAATTEDTHKESSEGTERSFEELREKLKKAQEQLKKGFPGELDYNASKEELTKLEKELDKRTNGQYHLLRELREDLAAGKAIGDQLEELKKEAVELSKKKGKSQEGKFIREEIRQIEEAVQGRERGPIRRPELQPGPWMTSEDDIGRPEPIMPREYDQGMPEYGTFDNIHQVVFAVRQQLNDIILRNDWIQEDTPEHAFFRNWLRQAEDLARAAGGEGTEEWRIYQDLDMEYKAVRYCLAWWHDGVLSHKEPSAVGFTEMQNRGQDFTGKLIKWLMTSYRGQEIREALGQKWPNLEITDFENPNVVLAAMFRLSTALAIKDGGRDPFVQLKIHSAIRPEEEIYVLANPFSDNPDLAPDEVLAKTEKGTGYLYEMYRIFNLDAYGMKYLKTRHANFIYALEFSHMALICEEEGRSIPFEDLLSLPESERVKFGWDINLDPDPTENQRQNLEKLANQRVPVFINHLNSKLTDFYTLWQEQEMAAFWHRNLTTLLVNNELDRLHELGWQDNLSPEENLNELADGDYALLKRNLINLRAGDITNWQDFDWSAFPDSNILNTWCQHLNYMQETMKQIVDILRGDKVQENIIELGKGAGMKYVPENLADFKERERLYWSDAISYPMLYSLRTWREKGNRHPLAVQIRKMIPEGFYRGFLRKFDFLACGIRGVDWALHPERMMTSGNEHLAVRQFIQRLSEIKIVREGILNNRLFKRTGITYRDLLTYAGLKKPEAEDIRFDFIPFGPELSSVADLDILEDYFAIPQEFRDQLLEHLGNSFRARQAGTIFREKGQDDAANAHFARAKEFLQQARDYLTSLQGRRIRVPGPSRTRLTERVSTLDDAGLLTWYLKIKGIHFKEEIETEINLRIFREYLSQPEENREAWLRNNYNVAHLKGRAEEICQVWVDFGNKPLSEQERVVWRHQNRQKVAAIERFISRWPGRSGWNRMEQGELIMAVWSAIDSYLAPRYEDDRQLRRRFRFFGPWYDLWERETSLFRIMRRQKACMDYRTNEEKRMKPDLQDPRNLIHAPEDVIIGRYIHDQEEWDEEDMELTIHESQEVWDETTGTPRFNQLRGIDRLASMMMGTGEYWPGDPREVSPLYYGHTNMRLIRRFISRQTIGYWFKNAINASRQYNLSLEEYWQKYRPDREVMTPQKIWGIIQGLFSKKIVSDFNEMTDLLRLYGVTDNEVFFFRDERQEARIRDIEDKAEATVRPEYRGTIDSAMGQIAAPAPGGLKALYQLVMGGQTDRERTRIARNAVIGFFSPTIGGVVASKFGILAFGGLYGFGLGLPAASVAIYFSLDKGDQVRGWHAIIGRKLGTLMKEREDRRDPYVIKRGYTIPILLPGNYAHRLIFTFFLTPAAWDDWVDGDAIVQAVGDSRSQLGSESTERAG